MLCALRKATREKNWPEYGPHFGWRASDCTMRCRTLHSYARWCQMQRLLSVCGVSMLEFNEFKNCRDTINMSWDYWSSHWYIAPPCTNIQVHVGRLPMGNGSDQPWTMSHILSSILFDRFVFDRKRRIWWVWLQSERVYELGYENSRIQWFDNVDASAWGHRQVGKLVGRLVIEILCPYCQTINTYLLA